MGFALSAMVMTWSALIFRLKDSRRPIGRACVDIDGGPNLLEVIVVLPARKSGR